MNRSNCIFRKQKDVFFRCPTILSVLKLEKFGFYPECFAFFFEKPFTEYVTVNNLYYSLVIVQAIIIPNGWKHLQSWYIKDLLKASLMENRSS